MFRLQCSVDRLGPMVLSWRRVDNTSTSGSSYLATGSLVMSANKRMSLLSSTTSSTLLITLVRPEDEGGRKYYANKVDNGSISCF